MFLTLMFLSFFPFLSLKSVETYPCVRVLKKTMNKSLFTVAVPRGAGRQGAAMFKGLPCWPVHTAQLKAGTSWHWTWTKWG